MGGLINDETLKKFDKFNSLDISGQRDLVSKSEGIGYLNMLFEIISACSTDNFTLMYIIPTVDGIILGKLLRLIRKFHIQILIFISLGI